MSQPYGQYPQQQSNVAQQAPAQTQQVKFYKSGLFGLSSAPGRFERDARKMNADNWHIAHPPTYLGINAFFQRTICVIYKR